MNSELDKTTNVNDPFQPATEANITRRSFLKRTAATILITVLAVNVFAEENTAQAGGESSVPKHYTIRYDGGSWPATQAFLGKQQIPKGVFAVTVGNKSVSYNIEVTLLVSQGEQNGAIAGISKGATADSWTFTGTVNIVATPETGAAAQVISVSASGQVVKYLDPDTNSNPFYTGSEGGSQSDTVGEGAQSVGITAKVDWNKDGLVLSYTINGSTSSPAVGLQLPVVEKL